MKTIKVRSFHYFKKMLKNNWEICIYLVFCCGTCVFHKILSVDLENDNFLNSLHFKNVG